MRLPTSITQGLADRLIAVADRRPPNFVIGEPGNPYLLRWYILPRNRLFNVYLHCFMRSDDDRALHDHPWFNLSILLRGAYVEEALRADGGRLRTPRSAGAIKARSPWAAHRIEVDAPAWTLFITGPKLREWGFHCPAGWRRWTEFVSLRPGGNGIGRGCE